jgi:hypothetical protein
MQRNDQHRNQISFSHFPDGSGLKAMNSQHTGRLGPPRQKRITTTQQQLPPNTEQAQISLGGDKRQTVSWKVLVDLESVKM